jgi:hypothetical protein
MPIYSNVNDWGGNSISKLLFDYLLETLPEDKTILELGSGWGTGKLVEHWNVWSIEDNEEWVGKYHDQYIYAPKNDGWYDYDILKDALYELQGEYDLLLIDGPYDNREKFLDHMHLFSYSIPVVFDDVRRREGQRIIQLASAVLDRPYEIYGEGRSMFGVIK